MSDLNAALRALVAEIVRETLPIVLAEIAPRLAASDDDVILVERAAELGLTPRVLADAIRRGEIPGVKLGRKLAAKRSEIVRWRDARAFRPRRRPTVLAANDSAPLDFEAAYQAEAQRHASGPRTGT